MGEGKDVWEVEEKVWEAEEQVGEGKEVWEGEGQQAAALETEVQVEEKGYWSARY